MRILGHDNSSVDVYCNNDYSCSNMFLHTKGVPNFKDFDKTTLNCNVENACYDVEVWNQHDHNTFIQKN